jgi:spermidine synthase
VICPRKRWLDSCLFAKQPEDVLVVGLGSGVTLHSVLTHPVREVECIELEDAVVRGAHFFATFNHNPLDDPWTRLIVNDARNHLRVTDRPYDVIISEPSNPRIPGAANLFTKEFFDLVKARLKPNGVFGQWVQLYELEQPHFQAILRTITSTFEHVHVFRVRHDALLVASEQPLPVQTDAWQARLNPSVRADLARINIHQIEDLLAHYWIGGQELQAGLPSGPRNTDDNMLIEFAAPLQILSRSRNCAERQPILAEAFLGQSTGLLPHLTVPAGVNPADYWALMSDKALGLEHVAEAEVYARHVLEQIPHPLAARI